MARKKQQRPHQKAEQSPKPEPKKRKPSGRIIHRLVLDDEGRPVCPRCNSQASEITDYYSKGNGMIRFIRSCECGARYSVDKHIRFVGSPYLDRWPEPEERDYLPDQQALAVQEGEKAEAMREKRRQARRKKKEEAKSRVVETRDGGKGSGKVRSRGSRRESARNSTDSDPAEAVKEASRPFKGAFSQAALPGVS